MKKSVKALPSADLLRITVYDRLHSFLAAMIAVTGMVVLFLAMAWLADKKIRLSQDRTPILLSPFDDHLVNSPTAQDIAPSEPSEEEFPELSRENPALEIREITQALSNVATRLGSDSPLGNLDFPSEFRGVNSEPKTLGTRWSVDYQFPNLKAYAKSLVANQIRILVVRQNSDEIVVVDLSGQVPARVTRRAEFERAVYFAPIRPELERWNAILVKQQGVDLTDAFCVHWYDDALIEKLTELEQEAALQSKSDRAHLTRTSFELGTGHSNVDWRVQQQVFSRSN